MLDLQSNSRLNEAAANIAGRLKRPSLAPVWITVLAICLDMPVFATVLWFTQYAVIPSSGFMPINAAIMGVLTAAASVGMLALGGGYRLNVLRKPVRATLAVFLALAGPITVTGTSITHTEFVDFILTALLALATIVLPLRLVMSRVATWVIDSGLIQRRAVIAGGGEHAAKLIRGLALRAESDVRLYGIFDDRDDDRSPPQVLGVPKIGGYDDLIAFVRNSEIELVIISLPLEAEERINWLLMKLKILPIEVRLSAFSEDCAFSQSVSDPLISAIRETFPLGRRLAKRTFDIVFATILLLIVWPVMLAAASAVWLETGGPIFFRQKRHGYNNRVIDVLKFRSMYPDMLDPTARRIVTRNDPRVTKVGRILRSSSIDELPQLFNVLNGDLSLVGPRPHAVDARSSKQERFSSIVSDYSARHRLPPGITGWAQIHGFRGEIDIAEKLHGRFEHDLYYIENWSIWLDLKILLKTLPSLLLNRTAY